MNRFMQKIKGLILGPNMPNLIHLEYKNIFSHNNKPSHVFLGLLNPYFKQKKINGPILGK